MQPGGGTQVSKITGLLLPGDNPAKSQGEWAPLPGFLYGTNLTVAPAVNPDQYYYFTINSNLVINPIDPTAGVVSSTDGHIFASSGPTTGLLALDQRWFPIANPTDLDSSYAPALAYGAPSESTPGVLDNLIYAGTVDGNVFVTFTGGGAGTPWTKLKGTGAGGTLDGTSVLEIVTDPKHGSHDLYAVTRIGVYYMADSSAANPTWVNITGNLYSTTLTRAIFGNPSDVVPALASYVAGQPDLQLTSLVADWRFRDSQRPQRSDRADSSRPVRRQRRRRLPLHRHGNNLELLPAADYRQHGGGRLPRQHPRHATGSRPGQHRSHHRPAQSDDGLEPAGGLHLRRRHVRHSVEQQRRAAIQPE